MQTRPQVVVTGQGSQRAGSVAIPLVQERREGSVHPLGTLWTSKLLCLKHLNTKSGEGGLFRDGYHQAFQLLPAHLPRLSCSALLTQNTGHASSLAMPHRMVLLTQRVLCIPLRPYLVPWTPIVLQVLLDSLLLTGSFHRALQVMDTCPMAYRRLQCLPATF